MRNVTDRLIDLDARHNELLERLTILDEEITQVLAEWSKAKDVPKEQNAVQPFCNAVSEAA